jgi:hypothetical protein
VVVAAEEEEARCRLGPSISHHRQLVTALIHPPVEQADLGAHPQALEEAVVVAGAAPAAAAVVVVASGMVVLPAP